MSKKLFAFVFVLVVFCSCSKRLKDTQPPPLISSENISMRPPATFQKIDFTKNDTTIVFGDSWTDYGFEPNNYIKLFADTSSQVVINKALIGLGSAHMVAEAFRSFEPRQNNVNIVTLTGFNDIRFTGATEEMLNFQKNAYRALLVNQFINTWRPAGEPDRFGGSFISFDQYLGQHFKSSYSNGRKAAYTSSTNGVYLEYEFTGTNVGVSFVGQDTTAMEWYERPMGRWRVLIDGILVDIPNSYQQTTGHMPGYMASQKYFPHIRMYSGLSSGPHVLRLEPVGDGNKFLDFIFTLRDPSSVNPVVIMKVPYMTEAGYKIDANANQGSDAAIDQVNNAIAEVRNEFGMIDPNYTKKIKLINTVDFFKRETDYRPDLIHPNVSGQFNLLNSLKANIAY